MSTDFTDVDYGITVYTIKAYIIDKNNTSYYLTALIYYTSAFVRHSQHLK